MRNGETRLGMNVKLDWQVGNDNGGWETLATTGNHTHRRVPGWTWGVLIAAFIACSAGGWFVVRRRYKQTVHRMTFQIQSVIDLETQSLDHHDIDRYLALQDEASPKWYALQTTRVGADRLELDPRTSASHRCTSWSIIGGRCPPVLSPQ